MLIVNMTNTFKIGDTRAARINGKPTQVTWQSENVLIVSDVERDVIQRDIIEDDTVVFICD